jgi:anti-sigma B factor antagonist
MVSKLIDISRLQSILTLIPTVSEAVDYVMMDELERGLES